MQVPYPCHLAPLLFTSFNVTEDSSLLDSLPCHLKSRVDAGIVSLLDV